jgi:membrane associated rhomboid family serine protease
MPRQPPAFAAARTLTYDAGIMGFQDRGYYRSDGGFGGDWTAVNAVIMANVAIWLANFILAGNLLREILPLEVSLNDVFCLTSDLPLHPWKAWQLLTYGFLHDGPSVEFPGLPYSPLHLLFNMLTLWFFGREVEGVVRRAEFLRFYLVSIVVAGLAWVIAAQLGGQGGRLVGASGGVMAVLAVFIWYFPRQTVLIYGVLPVPAWALGILYFFSDIRGAAAGVGNVAHVAHIAGATFGLLYAWRGWRLDGLAELPRQLRQASRRMRVVRPDDDGPRGGDDDEETLQETVDRILAKISRSGASSLTAEERDTLTRASRRLKEREQSR